MNDTDRYERMNIMQEELFDTLREAGWTEAEAQQMIDDEYPEQEAFEVTDPASADWVLRKMAEAEEEIKAITLRMQDEVNRLVAKAESLAAPHKRKLEFFRSTYSQQLEAYARKEAARTGKKTVKGLYGDISIKAGSKSLEWVGTEPEIRPLLAKAYPEAVQEVVTHTLLKTPIKEAFKDGFTGYIDGVQVARIVTAPEKVEINPRLP